MPEALEEIRLASDDEMPNAQPPDEQPLDDMDLVSPSDPPLDVDPEILRALGDYEDEDLEWGEDLHDDIAKRFQNILTNGLKKEAKEDLLKKYLFPKNAPFTKAPTLNPEISAILTESCKSRDKRLQAKQDQLGKALSAIGLAMSSLLKKSPDVPGVVRILNDASKLVADSHYIESDTRRVLVVPLMDKSLIEPFKDRKRDSFLFGDKLSEVVKSSQGIKRTGQYIQASSTTSASRTSLNWRGPPARGRQQQQQRSNLPFYRTGGQTTQAQYTSRRRVPPPPTRRTAPALPPPPPVSRQPQVQPRRHMRH